VLLYLAFTSWLNDVKRDAMAEQKAADQLAFSKAEAAATRIQAQKIEQARLQGIQLGKEISNGYARDGAAIDGAAAALTGLWRAETQANIRRPGGSQTAGVSGAPARPHAGAACAAEGWVSLPLAVELAAGADREAARGDALSAFITATAASWPK
jgi:hypothetical protein